MIRKTLLASSIALTLFSAGVRADVKLPLIFSDNMVLQADMSDPIWGTATAGEKVIVEINGKTKTNIADKDGQWMLKLDPQKAAGPFEMKVIGANMLTVKNVMIGEVWHASGQSNMRFPLSKAATAGEDLPKANFPDFRYFQVDPWHANSGQWVVCSPRSAGNFSAVAFYFAVGLADRLKKPIGILDSSVSGAVVQTFISPAAIAGDKQLADTITHVKSDQETSSNFNSCVAPKLVPYGIRGVIWYQGEGNRDYPVSYQKLFPSLIADWRHQWNEGDFPFLFVQLANYGERRKEPFEGKDAALREAQFKSLSVANTAMVVTIDCAPPIKSDVHYTNKKPVGDRLALAARALAYGEAIEYSGPQFHAVTFEGDKAIVTFTHVGGGLEARGERLTGFTLSGGSNKWVRADAVIQGDRVIVHNDAVPKPTAVRYAFERNPECNLYNKDGLPASPFRSDAFVTFATKDGE
jgi:sialate O-acetylesterase